MCMCVYAMYVQFAINMEPAKGLKKKTQEYKGARETKGTARACVRLRAPASACVPFCPEVLSSDFLSGDFSLGYFFCPVILSSDFLSAAVCPRIFCHRIFCDRGFFRAAACPAEET